MKHYPNNPMFKKSVTWLLVAVLAFFVVVGLTNLHLSQDKIEIALVSSLSNSGSTNQRIAENNIDAINLYLKSVNKAGGINGKQVVLSVYDDQGNPDVALKVAEKIVRSKAIAVLGHVTSGLTLAASKAYDEYNMPVISGSATADQLGDFDWFFRTVFSNQDQAVLMGNYAKKILNFSKISLVYSDDPYGVNLGKTVETTYQKLGGNLINEFVVGEKFEEDTRQIVKSLKSSIESGKGPEAVIAVLSFEKVPEFIKQVKLANLNLPIMGGDTLSDLGVVQHFADDPKEKENKGFFTNGIQAITPVSFDVLDDTGQLFKVEFEQKYKRDPGWIAACFHDGAIAVVESLKKADIRGKSTAELRKLVIERLKQFNTPATSFEGAGRLIYFDRKGNALTPAYIGLYDRQELISAFTQLQLVREPSLVSDLAEKVQNGEILKIGERYLQKTNIVYVGMDINELGDIDESTSSYIVDFYLWFRYKGDIPADEIEFTNYSVERLDSGQKLTLDKPMEEGKEDGITYKVYRMKADFSENFDFRLYPFDRQILKVRFRHANLTRDQLIYVIDLVGMGGLKSDQVLEKWRRTGVFESISSWIIERVQFFQNTLLNNSSLGNRQLIDANSDIRYSQFNANIYIKRDVVNFSIKNLLPLFFFIMIAYFLMFLPFEHMSIEAVSGLLLAVVFYHLSLIDRLPKSVGYTVLLDYAFYVVYALLGLQLLIIVLGNSERFKAYGIEVYRLMFWGRVAFPSIIGISFVCLFCLVLQRSF